MSDSTFFVSKAALRNLKHSAQHRVSGVSSSHLSEALASALGFKTHADLRLVPEFEHSYSPFRNFPLNKKRGVRWMGWRNLVVAAINAGLDQRLFGLEPSDNWWPGGNPHSQLCKRHVYRFELEDGHAAVASVDAISGDELSINVVLDPRHEGIEPDRFNGLRDGDAHAHAWVERRLGAWIQDGGEDFSCKRAVQTWLAQLKIDPMGYSDQGSFFM